MPSSRLPAPTLTLPAPLKALLRHLPPLPGTVGLALALNAALRPRLPGDVLAALNGRRIRLLVRDTDWCFDVTVRDGAFRPCHRHATPELTIGAHVADFARLARREVDADTLFFNRRLRMEGDTELGLLIKNTLDALELPTVWQALPRPAHWVTLLRETLPPLSCREPAHDRF